MKTLKKPAVGLASAALAVGAVLLIGSAAHAVDAPAGHTDLVEIACGLDGVPEYASHIGGNHVEPSDLDDWTFRYPSGVGVTHASGMWSVNVAANGSLADAGFNYEVEDGGEGVCPNEIEIALLDGAVPFANSEVQFDGSDTVTLRQGDHVHGIWTFKSPTATQVIYDVGFSVDAGGWPGETFASAEFVVG